MRGQKARSDVFKPDDPRIHLSKKGWIAGSGPGNDAENQRQD